MDESGEKREPSAVAEDGGTRFEGEHDSSGEALDVSTETILLESERSVGTFTGAVDSSILRIDGMSAEHGYQPNPAHIEALRELKNEAEDARKELRMILEDGDEADADSQVDSDAEIDVARTEKFFQERTKRIEELQSIVTRFEERQEWQDESTYTIAPIPENILRDELANSAIQLRSMIETNALCKRAKELFGRAVTAEEEEILYTTLDYVLKRIIHKEVQKSPQKNSQQSSKLYFNEVRTGSRTILPGGREGSVNHDLIHITLALKQGLDNENSPVPTFMHTENDFNSGEQAMLEEAFALLFTAAILSEERNYDKFIKNPKLMYTETAKLFNEETSPLIIENIESVPPLFSDPVVRGEAADAIRAFMAACREKLQEGDLIVPLALFSQSAGFTESLGSLEFLALGDTERLAFMKDRLRAAEENIDALITGIVPPTKDEKYARTVAITRDTCAESVTRSEENPDKPVFVEILLDTLKPLYAKSKAQAETTYALLTKKVETNPT